VTVRLEDEVSLEADALLVLDGENLRECLLSIEFFAQYGPAALGGFDRVASFGYTSSDRWAVAVSGTGTTESCVRGTSEERVRLAGCGSTRAVQRRLSADRVVHKPTWNHATAPASSRSLASWSTTPCSVS